MKPINKTYSFNSKKLNKDFLKDIEVIFKIDEIKHLTISESKWNTIIKKHATPELLTTYRHMLKQLPWFINKGYVKKGLKVTVVDGQVNIIVNSAVVLPGNKLSHVCIPMLVKGNTIIVKTIFIKNPIKK